MNWSINVCGSILFWSKVSEEVGVISQECLKKLMVLVKCV